ncbi:hypothetical protein NQZ68_038997 [Dissostichus eleginoides]|nr:hypothetical protein NQZ68_038997 [Dissostichus eleginoides]
MKQSQDGIQANSPSAQTKTSSPCSQIQECVQEQHGETGSICVTKPGCQNGLKTNKRWRDVRLYYFLKKIPSTYARSIYSSISTYQHRVRLYADDTRLYLHNVQGEAVGFPQADISLPHIKRRYSPID